jgi:hypothetical protein
MVKALKNLKGFLFAFILLILLTFIMSALIKLTPIPETWSLYYMLFCLSISCMFLSMYNSYHVGKRGALNGALFSVIFLLVVFVIYMMFFSTGIEMDLGLLKYLICVIFGSFGGMIGVNLRI